MIGSGTRCAMDSDFRSTPLGLIGTVPLIERDTTLDQGHRLQMATVAFRL